MNQVTTDVRMAEWTTLIQQCQSRPEGQTAKQKVSGQFVSQKYSEYFADIRMYIETCYRNGVYCCKALSRLAVGSPYTLAKLSGEA